MPILMLKGVVYINSGAILTIDDANVQFAYDVIENNDEMELTGARFQVKGGGTLIIKNTSILTGCDDGIWDGIESRSIDNSALIQINTNSTIKNAKIGITNDRRINFYKNYVAGGVIQAENANFINNRLGIELKMGSGACYFKNCQFNYNSNTLFTYPATTQIGEWNAPEMTFVHLKNGQGIKFEGNNFETDVSTFEISERGTGIFSESASYSLQNTSGLGNGNNTFKNLTTGINKIVSSRNVGQLIAEGNTFTNIPYGIRDKSSTLDIIKYNNFSIPSSDVINNTTYGIFMIGSTGFNLTENTFTGNSSTNSSTFGSHGIAIENSGSIASTCFENHFRGTDYGIHTQGNNINLKLRCNIFSEDGVDHNESGIYVYDGILKNQGNSLCDGDPSQAAGNTWLGPKDAPGESMRNINGTNFIYYANPTNFANVPNTSPSLYDGNITVPPTFCNISTTQGGNCTSSTDGLGVFGSASWYDGILELIKKNINKIKEYRFVFDQLGDKKDDREVNAIRELIEWYINENQFLENELIQAYFYDPEKFGGLDETIIQSATSESYKVLSNYYLNIKDYKKCRQNLELIVSAFKEEALYSEKSKNELKEKENDAFIKYMTIIVDLAEKDLTLFDLSPEQYKDLKSIIEQKVQISAMAENDLHTINNSFFEHPIYKQGGEKSMKVNNSKETYLQTNVRIYPNPTNGSLTLNYFIPENSSINAVLIYDAMGKLKKSFNIDGKGEIQFEFDCSEFANGVYNCHVVSDKQTINTSKIVIVK
jgi:hypothetical protein